MAPLKPIKVVYQALKQGVLDIVLCTPSSTKRPTIGRLGTLCVSYNFMTVLNAEWLACIGLAPLQFDPHPLGMS